MNWNSKFCKKTRMDDLSIKVYRVFYYLMGFPLLPHLPRRSGDKPEYIVSLTSWEPRFGDLPYALKSILLQSRLPDKIIIYFGNDVDPDKIPESITRFKKKGVEFRFTGENIKAHKKYYYAMKEFPESSIITVDDDVLYSPFTVSSLIKTCEKYGKKAVCARRTHRMKFNGRELLPYNQWKLDQKYPEPRYDLMGTGIGGIIYPPHCVHPDIFMKDALTEVALSNDDLWLKGMELLQGTKVKSVDCLWSHPISLEKIGDDPNSLYNINVLNNENDRIFERIQKKYPDVFEPIYRELDQSSLQ